MSKSKKALYMGDQMMQSTPAAYTISKLYLYSTHRFDADTVPGKGIHSHGSGQLSRNRVPASAGANAGMIASVGWLVSGYTV